MFTVRRLIINNTRRIKKVEFLFKAGFLRNVSMENKAFFSSVNSLNNNDFSRESPQDTSHKDREEKSDNKKNQEDQSSWDFKAMFEIGSKAVDMGMKIFGLFLGHAYLKAKEENEKLDRILNSTETRVKFIEALLSDDTETVSTLIGMGVNVSKINPNGSTFFHFAATCAGENTFKLLCEHLKNSNLIKDRNGFTPLHRAVFKGNETTVRVLVGSRYGKTMINERDKTGYTPLHMAAYMGFGTIVDTLLEAGSNSLDVDYHDQTPYDYAVQCGYPDIAKKLKSSNLRNRIYDHKFLKERLQHPSFEGTLHAGADPFEKDEMGNTALHAAISKENIKLIIELLTHAKKERKLPSYINEKNRFGESPILLATILGRDEIVKDLLKHGADPNVKMNVILSQEEQESLSPEKREIYSVTIDQAPTALHIAASLPEKDKSINITKLLLDKIDRNSLSKDKGHWSPVHRAAAQGNIEVLKLLLENLYSVNIYSDSWSPLHEAVCSGQVEAVKFLLENYSKEINVSPQEECGETPLHMAVKKYKYNPKAFFEIINLLIEHKANLDVSDNDHKTASDYAFYLSNWEILNKLRGEESKESRLYLNSHPFYERNKYNIVSSSNNTLTKR